MCRFRPFIFFPPVEALLFSAADGFHALRIDDDVGGVRVAALLDPVFPVDFVQNLFPGAPFAPPGIATVHAFPVGKIMGQLPPLASRLDQIQDGINHEAQGVLMPVAIAVSIFEPRTEGFPLRIGQIAGIIHGRFPQSR